MDLAYTAHIALKYWPIICGCVLYIAQGIIFYKSGQLGMAGMFAGYSLANIAIVIAGEGI